MRRLLTFAATTALLALLCVAPATAAAPAANPVADCNAHTSLTRHYTAAQLQHGLATMPADVREYTNCYDVLNRALTAQLAAAHGGSGGGGGEGGGSILPAPVLAVLAALVVAAAGLGVVALRRRSAGGASG